MGEGGSWGGWVERTYPAASERCLRASLRVRRSRAARDGPCLALARGYCIRGSEGGSGRTGLSRAYTQRADSCARYSLRCPIDRSRLLLHHCRIRKGSPFQKAEQTGNRSVYKKAECATHRPIRLLPLHAPHPRRLGSWERTCATSISTVLERLRVTPQAARWSERPLT
jgi:hypothetical protein